MPRKVGRPNREFKEIDRKLASMGGAQQVITAMDREELVSREIADRLLALTGVRVHPKTIRNWLHNWADEPQEIAQ